MWCNVKPCIDISVSMHPALKNLAGWDIELCSAVSSHTQCENSHNTDKNLKHILQRNWRIWTHRVRWYEYTFFYILRPKDIIDNHCDQVALNILWLIWRTLPIIQRLISAFDFKAIIRSSTRPLSDSYLASSTKFCQSASPSRLNFLVFQSTMNQSWCSFWNDIRSRAL